VAIRARSSRICSSAERVSVPDRLDQDALRTPAIEFPVEDLLPRSEVQLAIRDGDDDLAAHDLPLVVRVSVVLSGPIVAIA